MRLPPWETRIKLHFSPAAGDGQREKDDRRGEGRQKTQTETEGQTEQTGKGRENCESSREGLVVKMGKQKGERERDNNQKAERAKHKQHSRVKGYRGEEY